MNEGDKHIWGWLYGIGNNQYTPYGDTDNISYHECVSVCSQP